MHAARRGGSHAARYRVTWRRPWCLTPGNGHRYRPVLATVTPALCGRHRVTSHRRSVVRDARERESRPEPSESGRLRWLLLMAVPVSAAECHVYAQTASCGWHRQGQRSRPCARAAAPRRLGPARRPRRPRAPGPAARRQSGRQQRRVTRTRRPRTNSPLHGGGPATCRKTRQRRALRLIPYPQTIAPLISGTAAIASRHGASQNRIITRLTTSDVSRSSQRR